MQIKRSFTYFMFVPIFVICISDNSILAAENDSLAYTSLRDSLLTHTANPAETRLYLDASDALAQEGLHAEASALLRELTAVQSSDALSRTVPSHDSQKDISRFATLSGSYNRFEYIDTSGQTGQQLDSIRRLLDKPFNYEFDGGVEWKRDNAIVHSIVPHVFLSDRRAGAGVVLKGDVWQKRINFDMRLRVEKGLFRDCADTTLAEITRPAPSDMFGLKLRNTIRHEWFGGAMEAAVPLIFDLRTYREGIPGYLSSVEYIGTPELSWYFDNVSGSLRFSWLVDYEKYSGDVLYCTRIGIDSLHEYKTPADSFDIFSQSPSLAFDMVLGKTSFLFEGLFTTDYYPKKSMPERVVLAEVGGRISHAINKTLSVRVRSRCMYEEDYSRINQGDTSEIYYGLYGTWLTVEPLISINAPLAFRFETGVGYDQKWAPKTGNKTISTNAIERDYLWQTLRSYEPQVSLSWHYNWLSDTQIRLGYCIEDVEENDWFNIRDSKIWRIGGGIMILAGSIYSINIQTDIDLRTDRLGEKTNNISVLAGISARW